MKASSPLRPDTRPIGRKPRTSQLGSTLLEVLVSVLIFSFGVLGLVAMQVRATQFSVDAEDRGRAALLADDLAAQMRLARTVTLLPAQRTAWEDRVRDPLMQGLPNAVPTVNVISPTNALITITWQPPRAPQASQLVTEVWLTAEEL